MQLRDVAMCLRELSALGFGNTASVHPGGQLACGQDGHIVSARDVSICAVRRVEGETDPSEEQIVLGLACNTSNHRSAIALTYGPGAAADDADVLLLLDTTAWMAAVR